MDSSEGSQLTSEGLFEVVMRGVRLAWMKVGDGILSECVRGRGSALSAMVQTLKGHFRS